jgi:hypothetical protein
MLKFLQLNKRPLISESDEDSLDEVDIVKKYTYALQQVYPDKAYACKNKQGEYLYISPKHLNKLKAKKYLLLNDSGLYSKNIANNLQKINQLVIDKQQTIMSFSLCRYDTELSLELIYHKPIFDSKHEKVVGEFIEFQHAELGYRYSRVIYNTTPKLNLAPLDNLEKFIALLMYLKFSYAKICQIIQLSNPDITINKITYTSRVIFRKLEINGLSELLNSSIADLSIPDEYLNEYNYVILEKAF